MSDTDESVGRVCERGVGKTFPHAVGVTATSVVRSAIGAEPLWKIRSRFLNLRANFAAVIQLVECHLAKVDATGSNPVRRSKYEAEQMKISEFLGRDAVTSDLKATTKAEVIAEMVGVLVDVGILEKKHKSKVVEVLMAREALGSTAIGQGIAIPHGKSEATNKLISALGVSKKGIHFDSLDGEPSYIFFLLVAPIDSAGPHLKVLAKISRLLKDKFFRDSLKSAKSDKEILDLVSQEDARVGS